MGRRESSDSHRYIDRGGRRLTSVGLAQARPNYVACSASDRLRIASLYVSTSTNNTQAL